MFSPEDTGPGPLRAQVWLSLDPVSGRERMLAASRQFFRLGLDALGGELRDRLARKVASGEYVGVDYGRAVEGELRALCGMVVPYEEGNPYEEGDAESDEQALVSRVFVYTPQRFATMLDQFDQLAGLSGLRVATWRRGVNRLVRGEPSLELTWSIGPFDPPDPVLLYLTLPFEMLLGTVERQEAVLEFLRTVAGDANPAGGEVSYRPPEPMTTPLVHLFRGIKGSPKADTSAYLCRKWVRGYSWVTILAEELGQRLGGFEALQSSGAFYRVEHLAAGGFFLQATERFEQYQQEQGERVFATLAPVLPPFTPGTGRTPEDRWPRAPDPGYMVVHRHPSTVTEQRSSEGG